MPSDVDELFQEFGISVKWPKKPKRYLIFAYNDHYPSGGWGDFIASAESMEEVEERIKQLFSTDYYENVEVIDLETEEEIDASGIVMSTLRTLHKEDR